MKLLVRKVCVIFFYVAFSGHLWAGGGGKTSDGGQSRKRTHDKTQLVESPAPKRAERTPLFLKALREIQRNIKKAGVRLYDEVKELSLCLNCMCLEGDTLDEMGELGVLLSGLAVHSDSDGSPYDDPQNGAGHITPDAPPSYKAVCSEAAIEAALTEASKRAAILESAGCVTLLEEDLSKTLQQYPAHQGKHCHSAFLYEILRKLYMQKKQFEEALTNLELEFRSLPADFIENHDPGAITDYLKVLHALGRTDEAFAFLNQHVTSETRHFIRRGAALWKAQVYEEKGDGVEAENALIEALIVAHQDPQPYLALINHYHTNGDSELAQALTGVMKQVILPSNQWQEYSGNLVDYIRRQLPEPLRDYEYTRSDLMPAIRLWINKGQLDESSACWVPLIKNLSLGGVGFMIYGDDTQSLRILLLDLVNHLSLSADQRLQYYQALYRHRSQWIEDGFYKAAVVCGMLSALSEQFKSADQAFEMAQFIVDEDRKSGPIRHYINMDALKLLVEGHLSRENTEQAITEFIDLIRQFRLDSLSSTLQNLMTQLAPLMKEEQAVNALKSMFGNFIWVEHAMPSMISELILQFGEDRTAEMIKIALQAEPNNINSSSWRLECFLENQVKSRFDGVILKALLTHPEIESTWRRVSAENEKYSVVYKHQITRSKIKSKRKRVSLEIEKDSLVDRHHRHHRHHAPAMMNNNQLHALLSSINIHQHNVPSDGYCMWHALSFGLHQSGIAEISAIELNKVFSLLVQTNNYAPAHWGVSEHLAHVAQYYQINIIELLQTEAGELSGVMHQPLITGVETVPVIGANNVLDELQTLHSQDVPCIIMINNTPMNDNGSLELTYTNHWSAGTWSPSPLSTFIPENVQLNASEAWSATEKLPLLMVPVLEAKSM